MSDNASYFRAKTLHHYEKLMGLKHTFVSAYRPQGNGRLERFHRVLGRKIKIACQEAGHEQWDEHLGRICFAHNVVPHSTTGYSPFELVYGRLPCTPFDTLTEPQEEHGALSHKHWIDRVRKSNAQSHQIAHERMADKQLESMDRVAGLDKGKRIFKKGDQVLLFIPTIPKGTSKKLRCRWHGPYVVTEVNKGKQVTISMPKGNGSFWDKPVHCGRLKPYQNRQDINLSEVGTEEQSIEVFGILEEYEVQRTEEDPINMKNGIDALQRLHAREHVREGEYGIENAKWEIIPTGTERVGTVSNTNLEEEETPVPSEEPSPFDGQQLIEQAVCDLTSDGRVTTRRCKKCNHTRDAQHACWDCFNKTVQEKTMRSDLLFRGVGETEGEKAGLHKGKCTVCDKDIRIPVEQCRCDTTCVGEESPSEDVQTMYNMQYPVVLLDGQVRPRIFYGKQGLPPVKEVELWQRIDMKPAGPGLKLNEEMTYNQDKEKTHPTGGAGKAKVHETRAIVGYNEWKCRYQVLWKGVDKSTAQTIQDCMASTCLIEEYWSDPKAHGGVRKWKKLRPARDNLAQTIRTLTSTQAMSRQDIRIAGVQVHQATGKDEDEVYRRLQAHEIRSNDVFTVILDARIYSVKSKRERNNSDNMMCGCASHCSKEDPRKLYVPVRWTWNRLQKVCTKKQKEWIQDNISNTAKNRKHTCWMKGYQECNNLGGDEQNEQDIIIVPRTEMVAQVEQTSKEQMGCLQQEVKSLSWVKRNTKEQNWERLEVALTEWTKQHEAVSGEHHSECEVQPSMERVCRVRFSTEQQVCQAEGEGADGEHHSECEAQSTEQIRQEDEESANGECQSEHEVQLTTEQIRQAEGEGANKEHHSECEVQQDYSEKGRHSNTVDKHKLPQTECVAMNTNIDEEIENFKDSRKAALRDLPETTTIYQITQILKEKRLYKIELEESTDYGEEMRCGKVINDLVEQREMLVEQDITAFKRSLEHREELQRIRHRIEVLRASQPIQSPDALEKLEALRKEESKQREAHQKWEQLKEGQHKETKTQCLQHKDVSNESQTGKTETQTQAETQTWDAIHPFGVRPTVKENIESNYFEAKTHQLHEANKIYEAMLKTRSEIAVEGALRFIEGIMEANATTTRDHAGTVDGLRKCL